MPIFTNLRDSRGRFVGHKASNDIENALNDAISNVNPSSWKRFWSLTEQRLGMNPWEVIRQHGNQIATQMAGGPGRGGPPVGGSVSIPRAQPDPYWKRTFDDINKHIKHMDDIASRQHRMFGGGGAPQSFFGIRGGGGPGVAGGPPGAPWSAGLWWGGGAAGGGGRGGGGGPRGPGGGGGPGFWGGAGVFGGGGSGGGLGFVGRLLGLGFKGELAYEAAKAIINPVGALNRFAVHPLAAASERSWNYRTTAFNMGLVGGFDPERSIRRDAGGAYPGRVQPEEWMARLGMGPEEAQANLQAFGINPRSGGERLRNEMALGFAQRGRGGFMGMDPNAAIGFANTAMSVGVGGGKELGQMPLMERMGSSLEEAVARGLDRARILGSVESTLELMAKSGSPTVMFPQMLGLFDTLMKTNLPGGMTGAAGVQAIGGQAEALKSIGQDPMRTFTMTLAMARHRNNLRELLGPEIGKQMNPEMEEMLSQAQELANRGLMVPAAQILGRIIPPDSGRWLEIQREMAPQMLPFKGLQSLAAARGSGVDYPTVVAGDMANQGKTGKIGRHAEGQPNTVAESMWLWAKAHGYTDQAAAALIGHAMQESSLNPNYAGKDAAFGMDYGLFNMNTGRSGTGGDWAEYQQWMKKNGIDPKNWNSIENQMAFADEKQSKRFPGFRNVTDIGEAVNEFQTGFEQAAPWAVDLPRRTAYAREAYNKLSGLTSPTPTFDSSMLGPAATQEDINSAGGGIVPGSTQTFGDLTTGLPSFNRSRALASQSAFTDSDQNARDFGDRMATVADVIGGSFTKLGNAADQLGQRFIEIWSKLKMDVYGPSQPSQTTPPAQAH